MFANVDGGQHEPRDDFVDDGVEQKPLPARERDLRSDEFLANLPANHFTFEENMLRVALVKYCA